MCKFYEQLGQTNFFSTFSKTPKRKATNRKLTHAGCVNQKHMSGFIENYGIKF